MGRIRGTGLEFVIWNHDCDMAVLVFWNHLEREIFLSHCNVNRFPGAFVEVKHNDRRINRCQKRNCLVSAVTMHKVLIGELKWSYSDGFTGRYKELDRFRIDPQVLF